MEQNELLEKYTYVLEENARIKKLKQTILDKKTEYQTALQAKENVSDWGIPAVLTMILLLLLLAGSGLLIVSFIVSFFRTRELSDLLGLFTMLSIFIVIIGLICMLFAVFSAKYRDREEIEKVRIHNEQVIPAYKSFKESQKNLEDYMLVTKLQSVESQIPEDYRTEEAVCFFIQALRNGRADSDKELYNLFEEEKHRRKMEELTEKKLQQLEESLVHCPQCGSRNCSMVIDSKTKTSSFGLGDACCGYILFGPIGLLCGACGRDSTTKTKTYWLCGNCGKKFSN